MKKRHLNRIIAVYLNLGILTMSFSPVSISANEMSLSSPNGQIKAFVSTDMQGQLTFRVLHRGNTVIETSPLGITVDNQELGSRVKIESSTHKEISTHYPWRGGKNQAVNHCIVFDIPVVQQNIAVNWILEVRVFDDGVAYRYGIPGTGRRRIEDEATCWQLPPGTSVRYQTNTANYEGVYHQNNPENIPLETKVRQDASLWHNDKAH